MFSNLSWCLLLWCLDCCIELWHKELISINMLPLFLFMMMFFVTDVVVVAVVVVFVLKTFAINEMVYIRMLHQMPFHDSAFFLLNNWSNIPTDSSDEVVLCVWIKLVMCVLLIFSYWPRPRNLQSAQQVSLLLCTMRSVGEKNIDIPLTTGLQKDRYRGTSGT